MVCFNEVTDETGHSSSEKSVYAAEMVDFGSILGWEKSKTKKIGINNFPA